MQKYLAFLALLFIVGACGTTAPDTAGPAMADAGRVDSDAAPTQTAEFCTPPTPQARCTDPYSDSGHSSDADSADLDSSNDASTGIAFSMKM